MDRRSIIESRLLISGGSSAQRGVTLIELLIVMAILAFAATFVVMNAPPAPQPAREVASRFALSLQGAIDDAIINGVAYRVEFRPNVYRLARHVDGEWVDVSRRQAASMPADLLIRVEMEDAAQSNSLALNGERVAASRGEPVVALLDPFGVSAGFSAYFQSNRQTWVVEYGNGGNITVARR